jgi:hypothetical protein
MIVASAGFGRKISWAEDSVNKPPPGYKLTFRAALTEAIRLMFVRVLVPSWASYLPIPKLQSTLQLATTAYEELGRYMKDMIKEARADGVGDKFDADDVTGDSKEADLFRRLIAANDAEVGKLSEAELTSNVYVCYFTSSYLVMHRLTVPYSRHSCWPGMVGSNFRIIDCFLTLFPAETTAHTLSFAIGLLAIHPRVQQKVYEEAVALWPDNDWPEDDFEVRTCLSLLLLRPHSKSPCSRIRMTFRNWYGLLLLHA